MSTLTESQTPVERVRSSEYMSLKILEGRGVSTTGRPIRARRVPVKYRCRVMPVIDDDGTVIPVYVQEDGTVTKDIPQNADNDVLDDDEECDSDEVRAVFDDSDDIEDELTESEREEEAYWERQERIEKANKDKSKKRKRESDMDSDFTIDENEATDEEEYGEDDDEPEEENSEPATEPESEDEQELEDYYEKGAREWKPPSTKRRKK